MRPLLAVSLESAIRTAVLPALLLFAASATAQTTVDQALEDDLKGGRWSVSVRALDGTPFLSVNADRRVVPASTLKLVTTATALHLFGDFSNAGWPLGTALHIIDGPTADFPTLVLRGNGDATLSDGQNCDSSCLVQLVQAVQARGITDIQNIEVDDSLFEEPRWPAGWAQDDLRFAYGTAISALSVNDGVAEATIAPGPAIGSPPVLEWDSVPAFSIDLTKAQTSSYGFDLDYFKRPGASTGEIAGTIGRTAGRVDLKFGLDDPSLYAGQLFSERLRQAGIEMHGTVLRRETVSPIEARTPPPQLIYRHASPDPRKMLQEILHESNNVHAEVLLHHISLTFRDRTTDAGLKLMAHILMEAGAEEDDFDLFDGSGLSFYNRITPEAMSGLLVWASDQTWFESWENLLADNGEDGTLEYRLTNGLPEGAVRAKSGSVFGADGLAGYFQAASGREYTFAIYINDSAMTHPAARSRIDSLLRTLIATY
ncbi:MAG: D-alanyl-D-alanine carboxypeptidase/D-alanyl-D-alanine-endopeptidase [Henriciella sp.]|uniref:D-alanyl-D-alanine carboxypeptidase/D-alanyl-D-alanine endopeptidase n=1 Tax=Henriciella sp. TaxID=1968823 RepID=UPI0032EBC454